MAPPEMLSEYRARSVASSGVAPKVAVWVQTPSTTGHVSPVASTQDPDVQTHPIAELQSDSVETWAPLQLRKQ